MLSWIFGDNGQIRIYASFICCEVCLYGISKKAKPSLDLMYFVCSIISAHKSVNFGFKIYTILKHIPELCMY
jgi:hypothetical protein